MRQFMLLCAAVALGHVTAGAVPTATAQDAKKEAQEIRARSIVLVDEDGKERVTLLASKNISGLWVSATSGHTATMYASRTQGAVLGLWRKMDGLKAEPLDFAVSTAGNPGPFVQVVKDGKAAQRDAADLVK